MARVPILHPKLVSSSVMCILCTAEHSKDSQSVTRLCQRVDLLLPFVFRLHFSISGAAACPHSCSSLKCTSFLQATDLADERGTWSWVEASSPGSSRLYAKHGFETVHECVLEPGCPPLFFMERAPGSIEIGPCPVYVPYAYSTAEPARAMSGLSVSAVTLWGNLLIPIEVHGSRLGTGWHACTLTRVVSAQLILLSTHLVLKHQCMPKADSSRRNVS